VNPEPTSTGRGRGRPGERKLHECRRTREVVGVDRPADERLVAADAYAGHARKGHGRRGPNHHETYARDRAEELCLLQFGSIAPSTFVERGNPTPLEKGTPAGVQPGSKVAQAVAAAS
jgi:hypothetical protein